eukprot:TRINITY_DN24326_c0_g1_i1.p1 TRINITY_DN24326_c0_g1~~TRINITY_DN24326_c0_g1_i1.p1  ORF type:complete len:637 (-),score=160.53 TRINITY_DN24326_c0_g1_i1:55-1797(-)
MANRAVHETTANAIEKTKKGREKLNRLNLDLLNLQYEKNHYLREIKSCKSFPSVIETIGLISQEEFFETAGKDSLSPDSDPHQIMLKRLEYELKQRTELQETLKELKTRHKLLLDDNARRENFLNGLQTKLQDFVEGAKPIQQYISLNVVNTKQQKELALSLPTPLYTLYSNAFIYKEGCADAQFTVDIVGEQKGEEEKKKETKENQYEAHPLSLAMTLAFEGLKVNLKFFYLVNFNIVTLQTSSNPPNPIFEDVFVGLFPEDFGDDTPNLSNYYSSQEKNFRFNPKGKGRPFKWLQSLCGLNYLPARPTQAEMSFRKIDEIVYQLKARVNTILALETQLEAFAKRNITSDSKGSPVSVHVSLTSWDEVSSDSFYKRKRTTTTKSHRRSSSRHASSALPKEEGEVEEGEVEMTDNNADNIENSQNTNEDDLKQQDHNRYFQAIFQDSEKEYYFKARILVSPYYPNVAPIFKLSMKPPKNKTNIPTHFKAESNADAVNLAKSNSKYREDVNLKHFQSDINLNYLNFLPKDSSNDKVLTYQMARLKYCLEMYADSQKRGKDSSIVRLLGRPTRGRDRRIIIL